ncbi:type IV secretion system protein [Phyllobacterium phragmitis]|nr:type IV secretion system protein [Phyllobacterium phragmitis]
MPDTGPTIIASFLSAVDRADRSFVEKLYSGIATELTGFFTALLTIYVIWWGYSIISGTATASPLEAAERLAKAAFIYWIALNWAPFSDTLYTLTQSIPEILSRYVVKIISLTVDTEVNNTDIHEMLSWIYTTTLQLPNSLYIGTAQDTFAGLLSLAVIVLTLLFLGAALAGIIIAKVMLNIVLALGPVWIILALYNYSSRFTAGFLAIIANLMIQQILIYGFLGFYHPLVIKSLEATKMAVSGESAFAYVMPLMLVMMVGFYVLIRLPALASVIADRAQHAGSLMTAAIARSSTGWWHRASDADAVRPIFVSAADREAARTSIQREAARNSAAAL